MPIYDFKCAECNRTEERWAKMAETSGTCSSCGGSTKRLITSRIYLQTDYASSDFVTEDINGTPTRITSRRQERELCAQNEVRRKESPPSKDTYEVRVSNRLRDEGGSRWI